MKRCGIVLSANVSGSRRWGGGTDGLSSSEFGLGGSFGDEAIRALASPGVPWRALACSGLPFTSAAPSRTRRAPPHPPCATAPAVHHRSLPRLPRPPVTFVRFVSAAQPGAASSVRTPPPPGRGVGGVAAGVAAACRPQPHRSSIPPSRTQTHAGRGRTQPQPTPRRSASNSLVESRNGACLGATRPRHSSTPQLHATTPRHSNTSPHAPTPHMLGCGAVGPAAAARLHTAIIRF